MISPDNRQANGLSFYLSSRSTKSFIGEGVINFLYLTGLICLFLLVSINHLSAQNVSLDRRTKPVPATFIKNTDNTLTIDDVLKKDFDFIPLTEKPFDDLNANYWVLLDFKNEIDTLRTQKNWRLRTIQFREADLFYQKNGTIKRSAFGKFDSKVARTSFRYNNGVPFGINDLIEERYLIIRAKPLTFSRSLTFEYLSEDSNRFFTHYYTSADLKDISLHQIFLGACLIFFLTFMVIYFKVLKLEFLFYSLYVLFLGLYLGGSYISTWLPDVRLGYWLIIVSQVIINLFYVLFAMYYLNSKTNYPRLHILLLAIVPILFVIILGDAIAFQLDNFMLKYRILTFQRIIMTLFGIFSMLYLLLKAKDKLAYFIVIGSFCYMLGALGLLFLHNQYLMILGASIEILLFSLGLAYKIKKEYEAKLKLQEEVALKEISALRSQMNPHFIFNSLNSIQHLILQNNKVSALNYLSKFAKLTRNVLESSHMAIVTLDEEIGLIKSYLELESLRFDNSFDYTLEIDEELDLKNIEVPLLLVQPFVENALIHGLIGKKTGEKKLTLRFLKHGAYCLFEIEDNGIGRHCKKNNSKKVGQKSRGMEITEKRLQMLNTQEPYKNSVEIIDKYDSNGQPTGTKVIIRIHNP